MIVRKEKIYYPSEIMKDRKKLINTEVKEFGMLSMYSYNILLKQISADVYDSINKLKEWDSFRIKGSLYTHYTLGFFVPRKKDLRNMISLGLDNGKIAFDNYRRVLEGIDINDDSRCLDDIRILVEQTYNADIYTDNYDDYMSNLMARIATKYDDGDFNYNYLGEMNKRRDKVLSLEKEYSLNKK